MRFVKITVILLLKHKELQIIRYILFIHEEGINISVWSVIFVSFFIPINNGYSAFIGQYSLFNSLKIKSSSQCGIWVGCNISEFYCCYLTMYLSDHKYKHKY